MTYQPGRPDASSAPILPPSKLRIILAAERIFAECGVEQASLRDISMAAGHRNKFAAQYHFKNRDGLVLAILHYRRPRADEMRRAFLETFGLTIEECSDELLARCILHPLVAHQADDEWRNYNRFLYALLHYDQGGVLWRSSADAAPFTHRIYSELRGRSPHLPDSIWTMRMRALGRFCIDIVANHAAISPDRQCIDDAFADDAALMLSAMLRAPLREDNGLRPNR